MWERFLQTFNVFYFSAFYCSFQFSQFNNILICTIWQSVETCIVQYICTFFMRLPSFYGYCFPSFSTHFPCYGVNEISVYVCLNMAAETYFRFFPQKLKLNFPLKSVLGYMSVCVCICLHWLFWQVSCVQQTIEQLNGEYNIIKVVVCLCDYEHMCDKESY